MQLKSGSKVLDLKFAQVMGILNVTPDSFSDAGKFKNLDIALKRALEMLAQGASIIDVGGESTRPGAPDVSLDEELARVLPIIEKIKQNSDCWISIDTSKAQVMREAVHAGASILNDVRALQGEGALQAAAQLNVPVCLMHMQGAPRSMQSDPRYANLYSDVKDFLEQRIEACLQIGIKKEQIILDLGFGFGKTMDHNFALLSATHKFVALGYPLLTGISRKSMFGQLLNRQLSDRLAGSLAGALIAVQQGSKIIRVHDVGATVDIIKVLNKVNSFNK
ncbi:dihydropteroate synthase [Psychromonas sp. CD1]|uniref:dihydropteroate synthase n=1 Tax=Psychromonas sp. CD1 TaxID=1979839 RepID=UPI000B9B3558|nr:dihydropteroate synthase [Psychromonas sp. CD1]